MTTAIVLSGGVGTRLKADIPKQYINVNEKPIIIYCLEQLNESNLIDGIQIVADVSWHQKILEWLEKYKINRKFKGFSLPGETRQLSIFSALKSLEKYVKEDEFIFIHDAARPLLSQKMIENSIQAMNGHDGVLPVVPMKDTVYLSKDGKKVTSLLDRKEIFAGQAPECFVYGKYYRANKKLICFNGEKIKKESLIYKINGSTEPAIMDGMNIAMISGDENNFKITTPNDLERFTEKVLQEELI